MIARRRPAAPTPDPFSFFAEPAMGTPQTSAPSVEDLFRRNLTPEPSPTARLSEMLRQDYAPPEPAVPDYPPVRGFGYKIPISPQQQDARRGAGAASGAFGYDQIEQGAEDFLKQLQQRALQQAFKERGIHFDPLSGVRSTIPDGALPKPPGAVLRQGPTHASVRDKLGPLGKSNAGDVGLGDAAPVTGSLLALDDIAAMRAREAAGLHVGGVEKATTYLGALPIPGARPVSKAGRELVDRIARKIGGEPGAALRDKLIKDGLPAAENAAEGKAAVATALSDKSYVAAAMYRPDLGEITISNGVAGDPARSYQGGYGLSHIIERRKLIGEDGEAIVRDIVPDVLANGRVIEQPRSKVGPPRIAVIDKGHKVFLEQRWVGGRRSWVVSDFSSRNEGGVLPRLPLRGRPEAPGSAPSVQRTDVGSIDEDAATASKGVEPQIADGVRGGADKSRRPKTAPFTELPERSYTIDPMVAAEFRLLPQSGKVDPHRLRTMQGGASRNYKPDPETGENYTVLGTANQLLDDPDYADRIPPIRIFEHEGRVYTLDHRRVVSHRMADAPIQYRKATPEEIEDDLSRKLDAGNDDGMSIRVRRGSIRRNRR